MKEFLDKHFGEQINLGDVQETAGFLRATKGIFTMYRLTGLTPIFIERKHGEYKAFILNQDDIYSVTVLLVIYLLAIYITLDGILDTNRTVIVNIHCGNRLFITFLMHIRILHKRREVLDITRALGKKTGRKLSSTWSLLVKIYVILILSESYATQVIWKHKLPESLIGCAEEFIPGYIIGNICFLFATQVAGLHSAMTQLNKDMVMLAKDSKRIDIRPIMSRQVALRRLCCKLNQIYGFPMILATVFVFSGITFCLFECFETLWDDKHHIFLFGSFLHAVPCLAMMTICQKTKNETHEWRIQLQQLPIRFSTCEYFELDNETLKSVLSTIITYTVILVQSFEDYEPSHD